MSNGTQSALVATLLASYYGVKRYPISVNGMTLVPADYPHSIYNL